MQNSLPIPGNNAEPVHHESPVLDSGLSVLSRPHITELDVIRHFHPHTQIICSDNFMKVSQKAYPLPWLAREIVQNFVDANPKKGTLDDVEFSVQDGEDGAKKFVIKGRWPFRDPTSIIALDSDKSDVDPSGRSAGGNGIGLKQTILRLLRDYNIASFQIVGEGWKVDYVLVKKEDINTKLASQGSARQIKKDWLIGRVTEHADTGKCTYSFETRDQDVIAECSTMKQLGVSSENEHLKDPDIRNKHGALKWNIPEDVNKISFGRLFINGQVMRANNNQKHDFWGGPGFCTLQLNDVDYPMSIDRSPMSSYDLEWLVGSFMREIPKAELIESIQKTERVWMGEFSDRLWGNHYSSDGQTMLFMIIEKIFEHARDLGLTGGELEAMFGKKFVYRDKTLTDAEKKEISEKGYTILNDYFKAFDFPKASSLLPKEADTSKMEEPDPIEAQKRMKEAAKAHGIEIFPVDYRKLDVGAIKKRAVDMLPKGSLRVEKGEKENEANIIIPINISEDEMMSQVIDGDSDEEKALIFLRGLVFRGLMNQEYVSYLHAGNMSCSFLVANKSHKRAKLFQKIINAEGHQEDSAMLQLIFKDPKDRDAFVSAFEDEAETSKGTNKGPRRLNIGSISGSIRQHFARVAVGLGILSGGAFLADKEMRSSTGGAGIYALKNLGNFTTIIANNISHIATSTGKSLGEIVDEYEQSDIEPGERKWKFRLPEFNVHDENVDGDTEDCQILTMTENQKKQFDLLKSYVFLTTGYKVPNYFFVFEQKGVKGLNGFGKGIGLHQAMFKVTFDEALAVFIHEIAHNSQSEHDTEFARVSIALSMKINATLEARLADANQGKKLSGQDELLIHADAAWEQLKQ